MSQSPPSLSSTDAPASARQSQNPFFTISNLLSISRAVLAIPFAVVMLSDSPNATLWGIAILAVAALTDKLDGMFARKYNQVTDWGKILDPLADKIGMGIVAIVLVKLGLIPFWFVALLVGRDLLILAGGMYVKRSRGVADGMSKGIQFLSSSCILCFTT
ncbi:MAG: CDP-alcohol phosphatidyltransferase family protein, partial [bacterium]